MQVLKIEKSGERIFAVDETTRGRSLGGDREALSGGSQFTGKILRHAEFGLFIELEAGIEGLVHTSRLPLGAELSPREPGGGQKCPAAGSRGRARRRRLSLSLREVAKSNPWRGVADRFPEGEVAKGKVERLTNSASSSSSSPVSPASCRCRC